MSEKPYVELFCIVTFLENSPNFLVNSTREIEEPTMAEVCIPFEDEHTLYGITCYITNLLPWMPAIPEMMILKDHAQKLVDYLLHGEE